MYIKSLAEFAKCPIFLAVLFRCYSCCSRTHRLKIEQKKGSSVQMSPLSLSLIIENDSDKRKTYAINSKLPPPPSQLKASCTSKFECSQLFFENFLCRCRTRRIPITFFIGHMAHFRLFESRALIFFLNNLLNTIWWCVELAKKMGNGRVPCTDDNLYRITLK